MQKGAAEPITNFGDSQCSHIGRRNAAAWSVLLFSYVPRSSLLTIPLGSLIMKNFKRFFMSSSCTIAKCYKLCNVGKPKQASSLPFPFQQLCCLQNGGKGGRIAPPPCSCFALGLP